MRGRTTFSSIPVLSALAAAVLVLVTACGSDTPATAGSDASGVPTAGGGACGSRPIRIGMVDSTTNSFLKIALDEVRTKYAACSNVTIDYTTANNSVDAYNSAINAYTAQGFDAIITNDPMGDQVAGSLKAAYDAGVVVVPYINVPSGQPGTAYTTAVYLGQKAEIGLWADWLTKQLKGQGNILFLGGVAGNPLSQSEYDGLKQALAEKAPGIRFLVDGPVATGWDPAQEQQVVAGLLAKFPKIDAVVSDYGGASLGAVRAFQAANLPVPPLATTAFNNEFGCAVPEIKKTSPNFELFSVDGVVRISAVAADKAIRAVEQGTRSSPNTDFTDFVIWDTTSDKPPACNPALPPDADLSSSLTEDQLRAALS